MSRNDWKRPSSFSAPDGRMRVAVEIAYNGSSYCGWQSQNGQPSVQDTLLEAVKKVTRQENIDICGSGRTDSGVHAFGQVAHVELDECSLPEAAFLNGVNAFLPHSIRVKKSWFPGPDFHARYSAMAREYRYFFQEESGYDAFTDGLVSNIRKFPDINLLNSYARVIEGTHDFTTFACAKDQSPSKFRDIYESCFSYTYSMYGKKLLCYKVCGNAFLYHMVRSLVGTMTDFALAEKPVEKFMSILEEKNRSLCGKTAAPDGLYLWRVSYDPEEYRWFEEKYGK